MTQHPKLRGQLPGSMLDLLNAALESSRRALSLEQDDADTLFNCAQVLTSIAEALDDAYQPATTLTPLLEEATELFNTCLTIQEKAFADSHTFLASAESAVEEMDEDSGPEGGVAILSAPPPPSTTEIDQWAQIVEPITYDTLIDTILAQLESLALLCSKLTDKRQLAIIDKRTSILLHKKLAEYLPKTTEPQPQRQNEVELTVANFLASNADAQFRLGLIDFGKYERTAYDAYRNLKIENDPKGLADKAEAMLNFQSSLRVNHTAENISQQIIARWGALTQALTALGAAIKLQGVENLARIHLTRGDAELGRWQLRCVSGYPGNVEPGVMLKNAGVFYRGAMNQAAVSNDVEAVRVNKEATVKNALVSALMGDTASLKEFLGKEHEVTREVLEDCIGEGLLEMDRLVSMGFASM